MPYLHYKKKRAYTHESKAAQFIFCLLHLMSQGKLGNEGGTFGVCKRYELSHYLEYFYNIFETLEGSKSSPFLFHVEDKSNL